MIHYNELRHPIYAKRQYEEWTLGGKMEAPEARFPAHSPLHPDPATPNLRVPLKPNKACVRADDLAGGSSRRSEPCARSVHPVLVEHLTLMWGVTWQAQLPAKKETQAQEGELPDHRMNRSHLGGSPCPSW